MFWKLISRKSSYFDIIWKFIPIDNNIVISIAIERCNITYAIDYCTIYYCCDRCTATCNILDMIKIICILFNTLKRMRKNFYSAVLTWENFKLNVEKSGKFIVLYRLENFPKSTQKSISYQYWAWISYVDFFFIVNLVSQLISRLRNWWLV